MNNVEKNINSKTLSVRQHFSYYDCFAVYIKNLIKIDWTVEEGYKELLDSRLDVNKVLIVNFKKTQKKKNADEIKVISQNMHICKKTIYRYINIF